MSREHISRRRVLGGAGAGIAASMAGCLPGGGDGDGGPSTPEQDRSAEIHVLTDYSGEDSWAPVWEDIEQNWEEEDEAGLKVENVGMQGSGEDRLSTLIQSGEAPELFHGTITQVGDLIAQGQTITLDDTLDELVEANGDMLSRSTVEAGGDVRMLPHGVYLGGTFQYRTDIYEQLGLSVPKTMDELVENAKAIDEAEEGPAGSARGFALPATRSGKAGSDLSNFVYNNEGQFWRWTNEEEGEVELAFSDEDIVPALEVMDELAQYSPDPANMNWSPTIVQWIQGNVGQCIMNNAWLNGAAYANDSPIWRVTEQSLIPLMDRSMDPMDRGWALADGSPVLAPSHNHAGAKELWKFMYGTPDDQARMNLTEPMRFLPPYEDVVQSETYKNADIFQDAPSLLERNQRMIDEFAPELGADRPSNVATLYAGRFSIDAELVSSVVVEGTDPAEAVQDAREKYQTRIEEGRELAADVA
jgi:multiple sugar transport system substrate-binding protein